MTDTPARRIPATSSLRQQWVAVRPARTGRNNRAWLAAHLLKAESDSETLCGEDIQGRLKGTPEPTMRRCGRCARIQSPKRCAVAGCVKGGQLARGYCKAHYTRLMRYGELGEPRVMEKRPGATCSEDDCDSLILRGSRGFCVKHYARKVRRGLIETAPARDDLFSERNRSWVGDLAAYPVMHARLHSWRGRADKRLCTHCGQSASDWAYDLVDPAEALSPSGQRYSLDPWHYMPLCKSCHKRFDMVNRSAA